MLTSFANRKKSLSKLSSFSEGRHLLLISARICNYHKGFACISRRVTAFITATMNIARSIALRIAVHHTENHCSDFELSITALPSVPGLVVKAHAAACFMDWFVSKTHAKRVWTCWKTDERTHVCLQNSKSSETNTHQTILWLTLHAMQIKKQRSASSKKQNH